MGIGYGRRGREVKGRGRRGKGVEHPAEDGGRCVPGITDSSTDRQKCVLVCVCI